MKIYTYKGFNSEKEIFLESILVKDEEELKENLNSSKKKLLKIIKVEKFKKLKDIDLKNFYKNISRLLNAGIPIKKAIEFQSECSEKLNLKVKCNRIYNKLNLGEDILELLKEEEMITNEEFLIVYVSNTIGKLSEGFLKISQLKENKEKLKKDIQTALSYPIFIMCISTIIITMIFILIVPNFISIFESSEENLPIITKLIVGIYNFGSKYIFMIIVVFGVGVKLLHSYIKKKDILFKIPILKYFFLEKNIINLLENFVLLLKSGIAIDKSAHIVLNSVENKYIYRKFLNLKKIKTGKELSEILITIEEFSNLEINMIKIGEESGQTPQILEEICKFRQDNLNSKLKVYLNFVEPIFLLIIGVIISFFVIGLYLPILNMSDIIKI